MTQSESSLTGEFGRALAELYRKYSSITLVLHCHWVPSGMGDECVSVVIKTCAKVHSIIISHALKILMVKNVF